MLTFVLAFPEYETPPEPLTAAFKVSSANTEADPDPLTLTSVTSVLKSFKLPTTILLDLPAIA